MDKMKFICDLVNSLISIVLSFFMYFYNLICPSRKSVKNQIALVTGSGSGLGRGVALKLSELGCTLVLVDINQKNNMETGKMIRDRGGDCIIYNCDLSKKEDISLLAEKIKAEVGDIEILVNNAGIVNGKYFDELSEDAIQKNFNINLMAYVWLTRHFLPAMEHLNQGHIVNIASVAGCFTISRLTDYCASKFAVVGFTEALKEELRSRNFSGIKTTCICPFFVDTGMFDGYKLKYEFLLDGLKTSRVVSEIIDAILTDKEFLFIPKRIGFVYALKSMLPIKTIEIMSDFLGGNSSMDNFGNKKKPE